MTDTVVTVKQGSLRGRETKSEAGWPYISFKGIPYAEPPIGNLRFKDPQPKQSWTGLRDAVEEGSQCVQYDEFSHAIEGDEDCLYLNVATTSLEGSRPVMVWIHGGGFAWGNGGEDWYGPENFMEMDVVYVSINYRLGVFGFLQLDHAAVAGNMGLKDQVAGLKWVKDNIAKFGGNPNNVTIFGESAGSASVHYHILSPLSKGLFHKAIAQSGVAFNPWACIKNPVKNAHRLLAYLGKDVSDPIEIVEYLRTVSAHELIRAQKNISTLEESIMLILLFAPSIDSKSPEPFLPRPVHELASEAQDVPLIIGYNSHEGGINCLGIPGDPVTLFDERFDVVVAHALFGTRSPSSKVSNAAKEIRKFYFGDHQLTHKMINEFILCTGDFQFVIGIHDVLDKRIEAESPTYLYRFSYDAKLKFSTYLLKVEYKGAGHCDELVYLFKPMQLRHVGFVKPGSVEHMISKRFIRMWTDFAKTGNPTPQLDDLINVEWEPISSASKNYLDINAEISTGVNPDSEILEFWKRIRAMTAD